MRRILGSTEAWQVHGMDGELAAEYPVNSAANMPQKEYGYQDGQMLVVGGCDVVNLIKLRAIGFDAKRGSHCDALFIGIHANGETII